MNCNVDSQSIALTPEHFMTMTTTLTDDTKNGVEALDHDGLKHILSAQKQVYSYPVKGDHNSVDPYTRVLSRK